MINILFEFLCINIYDTRSVFGFVIWLIILAFSHRIYWNKYIKSNIVLLTITHRFRNKTFAIQWTNTFILGLNWWKCQIVQAIRHFKPTNYYILSTIHGGSFRTFRLSYCRKLKFSFFHFLFELQDGSYTRLLLILQVFGWCDFSCLVNIFVILWRQSIRPDERLSSLKTYTLHSQEYILNHWSGKSFVYS